MTRQLWVNMISESEFSVQGHGVHTAYIELTNALKDSGELTVNVNARKQADITHIQTVGIYALTHLLFGSGKKVVSAHVVPDSFVGSFILTDYWLWAARLYLRWFYNRADMVWAVSEETKRDLADKVGVTSRIEIFHNIVETKKYLPTVGAKQAARHTLGIAVDAFVVMGAGQVQPRKRVDSLVRLARELPDMEFLWVGGMPFGKVAASYQEMERMIQDPPKNMRFTGIIPLEAIKQYYHAADVFLLPSEQETFGLVVVEAAASGLPVVLRNIRDYDETFGDDALRVDEEGFKEALVRLRDDPVTYKTYSDAASRIAARYDSVAGAKKAIDLYRTLLTD